MNLSRAISHIKLMLGLYQMGLPFKDSITGEPTPTENVIMDVMTTVTIPIYSQHQPWVREGTGDLRSLKAIDRNNGIYILPGYLTTTPVMYVVDVSIPMYGNRGVYSGLSYGNGFIAPMHGLYRGAQAVASSQAANMLMGQMRAEPSFEYLGENKIRLYGFPRSEVLFSLACEHEPNGETIPDGCYESFLQLAALDMRVFLYNTLKLYDQIPSAFGNINLKIEEHQGADSERTALLNQWGEVDHLDFVDWVKFM